MNLELIPARRHHCGKLARALRHEHRESLERVGNNVHKALRVAYDDSAYARTLLIDGKVAVMGGITGSLLAPYGMVWIAMTQEATRYPIAVIKILRQQLAAAMVVRRELCTIVLGDDEGAKRLAIFMGFHVSDEGLGRAAYSRFSRKILARHIESSPDSRVPVGNGYCIGMGYHAEVEGS